MGAGTFTDTVIVSPQNVLNFILFGIVVSCNISKYIRYARLIMSSPLILNDICGVEPLYSLLENRSICTAILCLASSLVFPPNRSTVYLLLAVSSYREIKNCCKSVSLVT